MSYAARQSVTVTTIADGSAIAYSGIVTGKLSQIRYVKDGTTPYTDGVDFVVTSEATGEILWDEDNVNASATRAPRQATHDTLGVAAVFIAAGQAVLDKIALANDRVKIVIAAGGDTKTGVFHIVME
jgi:hypothetical protein